MHVRELMRILVPRWLDGEQACALSGLLIEASEAVWAVHEDRICRHILEGHAQDPDPDPVQEYCDRKEELEDLPF